jgi:hypothetical protein
VRAELERPFAIILLPSDLTTKFRITAIHAPPTTPAATATTTATTLPLFHSMLLRRKFDSFRMEQQRLVEEIRERDREKEQVRAM